MRGKSKFIDYTADKNSIILLLPLLPFDLRILIDFFRHPDPLHREDLHSSIELVSR